ncbi:MAG: FlgO family outer membrane protein [Desulfobacula sp.]|jgi:TolB-like protein|nr:FlgO family outer membrane protein [Desulfobacula sp.]
MSIRLSVIFIIAAFFMTGCAYNTSTPLSQKTRGNNLIYDSYKIVNTLEKNLKGPISHNDTIIIASFVDISDLNESSRLGRIMAEQVGSMFAQKGYKVIEMKMRQNSIFVDSENKGEFLLSREIQNISQNHNASAIVVGTYAKGYDKVYVSTRMINPNNSVVISSCDIRLNFSNFREMTALLKD